MATKKHGNNGALGHLRSLTSDHLYLEVCYSLVESAIELYYDLAFLELPNLSLRFRMQCRNLKMTLELRRMSICPFLASRR